MRLGRGKTPTPLAVTLPDRAEMVMLSTPNGGRIPARVLERGEHSLKIAITVPTRPLTPRQLEELVLEYNSPRGRLRLHGSFTIPDASDSDVLCMTSPQSVEVLQERDFVRIRASRPVIVYGSSSSGQTQSFTIDLSGGGFLLAGPDTLSVGEEIRFRLSITPGMEPVTGTGRVVRIDPQGRRAVAIEQISDLGRRRLVRFIFEAQRHERRRGLKPEGHDG